MLRLWNHPKASHVDAPRVGHERALRYVGSLKRRSSICVPMLAVPRAFQSANFLRRTWGFSERGVSRRLVAHVEELRTVEDRSEEHTSELQSHSDLVCRL